MELSIIIVSWNAKEFLGNCLKSIYSHRPSKEFEVVVVDNCSSDGSGRMLETDFPQVVLIKNEANYGFAKANNIGIRHSRGKYLVLVNSDVEVQAGCFDKICEFMDQNPRIGLSGPLILNSDESVQASCRKFPSLWRSFCEAAWLNQIFNNSSFFSAERMLFFRHDSTRRVNVLSGCFWAARRDALGDVGLLDERFFIYAEDMDWCRRFWESGWEVVFYPEARAIHHSGGSSNNAPLRFSQEQLKARLQYWKKYHGRPVVLVFSLILLLHHGLRALGEICLVAVGKSGNQSAAAGRIGTRFASFAAVWQMTVGLFRRSYNS
jgi:GT2 family glycosyltransferase